MIRSGNNRSVPELKKLWKECFADEDAYIDAFFEAMYEDQSVLLEEEHGVLLGASFFLPGKIRINQPQETSLQGRKESQEEDTQDHGKWQQIRYVYALAVYPQYRGRGVAAKLLHSAQEIYQAPLIAEPAQESLVGGFYKPLGFQENFYLTKKQIRLPEYDIQAAALPDADTTWIPVLAETYCSIRDQRFKTQGYISWPVRHVAFAIKEHHSSGGGAFVMRRDGREDLMMYFQEGRKAVVTETTLTQEEAEEWILPQMAGRCSQVIFTSPALMADNPGKSGYTSDCRRCLMGMSLGLPSLHGYLNLSLD